MHTHRSGAVRPQAASRRRPPDCTARLPVDLTAAHPRGSLDRLALAHLKRAIGRVPCAPLSPCRRGPARPLTAPSAAASTSHPKTIPPPLTRPCLAACRCAAGLQVTSLHRCETLVAGRGSLLHQVHAPRMGRLTHTCRRRMATGAHTTGPRRPVRHACSGRLAHRSAHHPTAPPWEVARFMRAALQATA